MNDIDFEQFDGNEKVINVPHNGTSDDAIENPVNNRQIVLKIEELNNSVARLDNSIRQNNKLLRQIIKQQKAMQRHRKFEDKDEETRNFENHRGGRYIQSTR